MDFGDTVKSCAKRELLEEAGLVADEVIYKDDGTW